MTRRFFLILVSVFLCGEVCGQPVSEDAWRMEAESVVGDISWVDGEVRIPGARASLVVSDGFGYLDSYDAQRVLTRVWENPQDSGVLGLLIPLNVDLMSYDAWGVVIRYLPDGFLPDDAFERTDVALLMQEMQRQTRLANLEFGYGGLELIGWAPSPQYDPSRNLLFWGKSLENPRDNSRTLNLSYRLLGRKGIMALTAVATPEAADEVTAAMSQLVDQIAFEPGYGYSDYDPSRDELTLYGFRGLIAETYEPEADKTRAWLWSLLVLGLVLIAAWIWKSR